MLPIPQQKKFCRLSPEDLKKHKYQADKEHEQRYAVHAVHQEDIYITRIVGVSLAYVQIGKYLVPNT